MQKNKPIILVILVIISIFTGCSTNLKDVGQTGSSSNLAVDLFGDSQSQNIKVKATGSADYKYFTPEQVFNRADVVIIGTFEKKVKSLTEGNGTVFTDNIVKVKKVIKGEVSSKDLTVRYRGGIVSIKEYSKTLDEISLKKMGIDKNNIKKDELLLSDCGKYQVKPKTNTEYLIFLNRGLQESNIYHIGSDALSCLLYKDNKFYDITTKQWLNLSTLK